MNNLETNVLPSLNESIIVHYGCSEFNNPVHKVFWIGAINQTSKKEYFFSNGEEVSIIDKFNEFILANKNKTFIHWSMNSPKFGFQAIQNRYLELTNQTIHLSPLNEIDLSEYLKTKYGIDYIDRVGGRLDNLATLNSFSGKKSQIEVINRNDASDRLELIFSIVQAELQGKLKIASFQELNIKDSFKPNLNKQNEPKTFNEMFEYPDLVSKCVNILKQVEPPIINNKDEFNLGSRSKGSIVAWISALKIKGIIKARLSDSIIAKHLNSKFKGLELGKDGRTLRNPRTTAYNNYYKTILNYLPELPLSTTGKNR